MRILLLGGNGQVGHELRRSLAPLGELVVTTRTGVLEDGLACERLDLAELDSIAPMIRRIRPGIVVNAAAYTAVDRAEDEPDLAFAVNSEAPARIAGECAGLGCPLIHYSTDYVFDGTATRPYREDHVTAPIGTYGASKLGGEQAIQGSGASHLILRTAWVYGLYGHNFLRTMLRLAGERDELRVVSDQFGSPTPAWLIADATAHLVRRGVQGGDIYHLVAGGETSWHGFALEIVRLARQCGMIVRTPEVVPIESSDYPTRAARPAYSVLDSTRIRSERQIDLPDWASALRTTLGLP